MAKLVECHKLYSNLCMKLHFVSRLIAWYLNSTPACPSDANNYLLGQAVHNEVMKADAKPEGGGTDPDESKV